MEVVQSHLCNSVVKTIDRPHENYSTEVTATIAVKKIPGFFNFVIL